MCDGGNAGCDARRTRAAISRIWQARPTKQRARSAPSRRVVAETRGAPERGAGAPLAGMRPRRRAQVLRDMARPCPAAGSHPGPAGLEPAPPCAGRSVARLAPIRSWDCHAPWIHRVWATTHHANNYEIGSKAATPLAATAGTPHLANPARVSATAPACRTTLCYPRWHWRDA